VAILLLLLLILYFVLQTEWAQNKLVKRAADYLSKELNTTVKVDEVNVEFFNKAVVKGILIEDRNKDTLAYIGKVSSGVNNWFFLKDSINITSIALKDVNVKLQRKDSVWNYQFIADYFKSNKTTKTNSKTNVNITLQEFTADNLSFLQKDEWVGTDMTTKLRKLYVWADLFDLNNKKIRIKNINIEQPYFWQNDYDGKRPNLPKPQKPSMDSIQKILQSELRWNKDGWDVGVEKINLTSGVFRLDKESEKYRDRFDGQHLYFENIQANIANAKFYKDTLSADINISAKEQSGLLVNKLQANFAFSPVIMEFKNLDLITNKSHLTNYYAMKYDSFNKDFARFLTNVTLVGKFNNTVVHTDDIALFAPNLKSWKRQFNLSGKAEGTLEDFVARDINLKTGQTFYEGNFSMHGLPNINETFIDFESKKLQTNFNEVASIAPSIKSLGNPKLRKLGTVNFKGNFNGYITDFVTYGKFNTALGDVTADVNMKIPQTGIAKYSGSIKTPGFKLGAFLSEPNLQNIAFDLNLEGQDFSLNRLKEKVNGTISSITYAGTTVKNIQLDGKFENKKFEGLLSVEDGKLKIKQLNGSIDFEEGKPGFKLETEIQSADLRALGIAKTNMFFGGKLNLNFTGNTIDNFLGNAKVENAFLRDGKDNYNFDYFNLNSEIVGGQKSLTVSTNEVNANVQGKFKILELPSAVQSLLHKYYPVYIKQPKATITSAQDFNFSVTTNNTENLVKLFDKRLSGFSNSKASGDFNLQTNSINLNVDVPQFGYDGKQFINTKINAVGTKDVLLADVAVEDAIVNDSLHFPNSNIQLIANNDITDFKINTTGSKLLGKTELNGSLTTLADGIKLKLSPSAFVLNDKKWKLEKDGELVIRKNFIDASEIKFVGEDETITVRTELDDGEGGSSTNLVADLEKVSATDFSFVLPKNPALQGNVTGKVTVKDIFDKQRISFTGLAEEVFLDGSKIGKLTFDEVKYAKETGIIDFAGKATENDYDLSIVGSYNLKDSTGNPLKTKVIANKLNLEILKPYLGSVFSNISGNAWGNFAVDIKNDKLDILGDGTISNAALTVGFTKVKYLIANQPISFKEGLIDFDRLTITDTLKNRGVLNGKIFHNGFNDFSFSNVTFSSEKIIALNTTKKDNSTFYGNVIGKVKLGLNGNLNNIYMNIAGQPATDQDSHLYLNTDESSKVGGIDYIEFIQFGKVLNEIKDKSTFNLTVDLNLTANPNCGVDVILDEATNDRIQGRGDGDLKIRYKTNENLVMNGEYNITKGKYTYNFQDAFKKPFELTSGKIRWNGDPYLAQLDIDAAYLAKNVDFSALGTSNGANNSFRLQSDLTLISHLKGTLKQPKITFDFKLPENSELSRNFIVKGMLDSYKNDETEMVKQVASLLVLNQFLNSNQSAASGNNTINIATGTIGGAISGWLTGLVNDALSKATKGILTIDFDINPYLNLGSANQIQANLRGKANVRIAKDLFLKVGANFDYNNPLLQLAQQNAFTPDFSLEYLVNKNGSIRVVGFNRTAVDLSSVQRNRSGVKLDYRKDASRFGDIFRSKKKIAELDSIEQNKPPVQKKG
jgi:hypothetical protein